MFAICDQEETYGTKNCADATSSLKWWMIVLMVLAIIFTCMCCAVTAILAKRQREDDKQDTAKEEHYMEKGEDGALPAPIKITIGVFVGILSIFLIIIIITLLLQSDTVSPKWWVFLLVLFAVGILMSCCVVAMLGKRNKDDDDQGKDGDGKDKVATRLPMPITIGVSVLAAVIIVLLIVIICPINQWNKGTVTMSSSSSVNAVKYSYKVGLFETNLKDTTTINGIDTVYSDITSDNSGKSKDAGEAAFALIMCTIILVGVATMLVVFLFSQIMLIVGIVLTARTTIDSLLT